MDIDSINATSFKLRLLFGLFEADATGAVAMSFVVVLFVLVGGGRWLQLW